MQRCAIILGLAYLLLASGAGYGADASSQQATLELAERLYFEARYAEAIPALSAAERFQPEQPLHPYRMSFALREVGAAPEKREAARQRALDAFRKDRPTPKPSTLFYLTVLTAGDEKKQTYAAIDRLLDSVAAGQVRFDSPWELSRVLYLTIERGRPLVERHRVALQLAGGKLDWLDEPWFAEALFSVASIADEVEDVELRRNVLAGLAARKSEPLAQLVLARILLDGSAHERAVSALKAGVELGIKTPRQSELAADVYQRLGQPRDAAVLLRIQAKSRNSASLWSRLGEVERLVGRSSQAELALERALALDATLVSAWLRLARLYADDDRQDAAIKAYQSALAQTAGNTSVRRSFVLFLELQDRHEKALEQIAQLPRADAESLTFLNSKIRCLTELERFEAAVQTAEYGLQRHPEGVSLHRYLALALLERGRNGDLGLALEANANAIRLSAPDETHGRAARVQRIQILWKQGEQSKAIQYAQKLLEDRPKDRAGWIRLSKMLLSEPDRAEEAVRVLEQALEHFPMDPPLMEQMLEAVSILSKRQQRDRS